MFLTPPPHPPSLLLAVSISFVMFPSSHPTESRPPTTNGTPLASPPDRAPRDCQPPPRVERVTPSKHQPYNPLGLSRRPTKYTHIPDKAPHDERPPPGVEKITPKHQPANRPGPSHRPTQYTPVPDKAPRERPPPVAETTTPTYYQPANPPEPPHRPVKFARVRNVAPRDDRPPAFGRIVFAKNQSANPPRPTDPPAESAPVLPSNNMPVNFTRRVPAVVRPKMLSYPFANNSLIIVSNL